MNLSRATGHCWGCLGVSASRLHPQERGLSWDPQPQERSRLHPQERGLSSDPQPQERSRLAEPCLQIPWGLDATQDSGPSQNIGERRPLKGSTKGTLPGSVNHPQCSSETQACPGSRDMIASRVREVGDKKVDAARLSFYHHLVDAAVQYTRFAILWLLSDLQPPDSGIVFMGWSISIFFFFFFCHRRIRRVLNIRSFWIIYLSYTFLCIHRKNLGDNYCRLSLRVTDFCVSVQGRKDRRREKNIPCGLSITDSHEDKDFLIHSRPFTYFSFLEPFVCLWILWVSFWIVNFFALYVYFILLGRYILHHSHPLPDWLPFACDPSRSVPAANTVLIP